MHPSTHLPVYLIFLKNFRVSWRYPITIIFIKCKSKSYHFVLKTNQWVPYPSANNQNLHMVYKDLHGLGSDGWSLLFLCSPCLLAPWVLATLVCLAPLMSSASPYCRAFTWVIPLSETLWPSLFSHLAWLWGLFILRIFWDTSQNS